MNAPTEASRLLELIRNSDQDALSESLNKDPNAANTIVDGAPLLHHACFFPIEAIAELLLKSGANINSVDEDGDTPLHIVSFGESVALMDLILRHRPALDAQNAEGITPLMIAAKDGSVSFEKLVQAGADITVLDNLGRSALHWAVTGSHDNAHIVSVLVAKGLDPLQKNTIGDTSIDYARSMNKTAILAELESASQLIG